MPGVDGIGGQSNVVGHGQVGGREPQFRAAAPVAVDHMAPHLVGPPEEAGRPLHVALGQEGPDAGRGHGVAPVAREAHAYDLEAVLGAQAAQQLDVAAAAVPEVEVLPHHDEAGRQLVDEDLLHEVLGRLLGPGQVEGDDDRAIDAAVGQQLQLLLQAGQLLGRGLGPHHRGRVAVEGDHHGGEAGGFRPGRQVAQEGAVPEVDPVVGPDGDSGPLTGGRLRRHRD